MHLTKGSYGTQATVQVALGQNCANSTTTAQQPVWSPQQQVRAPSLSKLVFSSQLEAWIIDRKVRV